MLDIVSYSDVITKEEIEKCCRLLNEKHKSLNAKIIVFKSKWQLLFKFLLLSSETILLLDFKLLKSIFKKQTSGTHFNIKCKLTGEELGNIIYIYPFNLKKPSKIKAIYVLFHEIRHVYQSKYRPYFCSKYPNSLSVNDKLYNKQPLEEDAIIFSKKLIIQNKNKIKKIIKGGKL